MTLWLDSIILKVFSNLNDSESETPGQVQGGRLAKHQQLTWLNTLKGCQTESVPSKQRETNSETPRLDSAEAILPAIIPRRARPALPYRCCQQVCHGRTPPAQKQPAGRAATRPPRAQPRRLSLPPAERPCPPPRPAPPPGLPAPRCGDSCAPGPGLRGAAPRGGRGRGGGWAAGPPNGGERPR